MFFGSKLSECWDHLPRWRKRRKTQVGRIRKAICDEKREGVSMGT